MSQVINGSAISQQEQTTFQRVKVQCAQDQHAYFESHKKGRLTSLAYLITNLPKISILITIFDISSQVLDQCTYRLGLNSAARGIYTEDGTIRGQIHDPQHLRQTC
jgi:hypothetical protein